MFHSKNNKSPKILFDLRAFNNYYEQSVLGVSFGCRYKEVKRDFETLLEKLKSAGAELIFVSKESQLKNFEDVRFKKHDGEYERGLAFIKSLNKVKHTKEVSHRGNTCNFIIAVYLPTFF